MLAALARAARAAVRPLGAAVLTGAALGGCGPFDLPLSWAFVDGRDCADAGVELIRLRLGEDEDGPAARCTGGQGGRRVTLPAAPPGKLLHAAAQSPGGGVLYRGTGRVPDRAPEGGGALQLILYYTGGQ